jgi:hypothetical protein
LLAQSLAEEPAQGPPVEQENLLPIDDVAEELVVAPAGVKTRRRIGAYRLTARPDVPDFRDWTYEPALIRLKRAIPRPRNLHILDQASHAACTGFGLAAAINLLRRRAGIDSRVSPLMLYEMAKKYDEWRGTDYQGSSCRGAIKGWYNMGVCSESAWPPGCDGDLTLERARDARSNAIGAYYRVGHRVSAYHAALNETGVVYCSAQTHSGWLDTDKKTGLIPFDNRQPGGGHAFAIVGYEPSGFWIQNSWGRRWGRDGTALWTYEDWQANVMDAWVFRLALPTPQLWQLPPASGSDAARSPARRSDAPARSEIAGHFAHIDDGDFTGRGRYWSTRDDVDITANYLAGNKEYSHLLLYAHGGLNAPKDSARRIAAMVKTFKANRIYPYHFMYDTGVMEEIRDVIASRSEAAAQRAAGLPEWSDRLIEWSSRVPGRALWREMKRDARLPFRGERAGTQVLRAFLDALWAMRRKDVKLHLVGHSTGAVLLAHLLETLEWLAPTQRIASCSLLAPAVTLDLFQSRYYPLLLAGRNECGIDRMAVYALSDDLEKADQVAGVYRKSLLYLVSRAFEEQAEAPLLGMQRYSSGLTAPNLELLYSGQPAGEPARTASRTHGGFDNDPATMNDVLETILGSSPHVGFTSETLRY